MPLNRSFMHLHLGFDAIGLDDLELHHIIVNSWEGGVDTEQACYKQCLTILYVSDTCGSYLHAGMPDFY